MKVTLKYVIYHEDVIEMTPQEYCRLRANSEYKLGEYFPAGAKATEVCINEDGVRELNNYFYPD